VAAVVALSATAFAAGGALDPSFNPAGNPPGTVVTPVGPDGNAFGAAVALQDDGKIVVAGSASVGGRLEFALTRYNPDGTLDTATDSTPGTSFGSNGVVLTSFGVSGAAATAVVIQPDGKIVAGGFVTDTNAPTFAVGLARYNTDGTLDSSTFGTASTVPGTVISPLAATNSQVRGLALQSDGKVIAAGTAAGVPSNFSVLVARYNADGTLDTATDSTPSTNFNTTGFVITPVGTVQDSAANAVALQPDGKIVAAGFAKPDSSNPRGFALVRYTDTGALDTTFNPGGTVPGTVITSFGPSGARAEGNGVAVQPDGKIVVAGGSYGLGTSQVAVARYDNAGALDSGFGSGAPAGTRLMQIGGAVQKSEALGVAVAPNGSIILVGDADLGTATNPDIRFLVIRLDAAGNPDTTFGDAGIVLTSLGDAGSAIAAGVALQSDGKIVAAGVATTVAVTTSSTAVAATNRSFAVARYDNTLAEQPPSGAPGPGGNAPSARSSACGAITDRPKCPR
jgi:uncharacterized delta-60 repeat protein